MGAVAANMVINPAQRTEAVIGLGFIAVGGAVYLAVRRRQRA